ncbi:MAG: gas vesicle protein [Leptolyngbya sp. RL_3_1]|nr:gas vesicle protein [Leptolyngbya sp. RL_3_1]
MVHRRPPSRIPKKISTMPRPASEATHYLDIYKLTIEKKRLQSQLVDLDQRRQRIQARLTELNAQTTTLEQGAQQLRQTGGAAAPSSMIFPPGYDDAPRGDRFDSITLDY